MSCLSVDLLSTFFVTRAGAGWGVVSYVLKGFLETVPVGISEGAG